MLALAGLAAWMKLGGGAIASEAEAIAAAEADHPGFNGVRAAVDKTGNAAMVTGDDDSVVVLKIVGARIASRHLAGSFVTSSDGVFTVATGDRWFGDIRIEP